MKSVLVGSPKRKRDLEDVSFKQGETVEKSIGTEESFEVVARVKSPVQGIHMNGVLRKEPVQSQVAYYSLKPLSDAMKPASRRKLDCLLQLRSRQLSHSTFIQSNNDHLRSDSMQIAQNRAERSSPRKQTGFQVSSPKGEIQAFSFPPVMSAAGESSKHSIAKLLCRLRRPLRRKSTKSYVNASVAKK